MHLLERSRETLKIDCVRKVSIILFFPTFSPLSVGLGKNRRSSPCAPTFNLHAGGDRIENGHRYLAELLFLRSPNFPKYQFSKVEIIENGSFCSKLFRQEDGFRFLCGHLCQKEQDLKFLDMTFDFSHKRAKLPNFADKVPIMETFRTKS